MTAARELSNATDEAVRHLARAASSRLSGRFALVALGGWGAGAMVPSSDLDILVLSDAPAPKLKSLVEAVLYPLWDSGLTVGHQVRSPAEQLRAMRDDLVTCTAALTARPLEGDLPWAEESLARCAADARKRSRKLLPQLATRPRPGSPYLLEPDLKQGAGGRRDYDELTWTASILSGQMARNPFPLVAAGILTADEYAALDSAAETIAAARWSLALAGAGNLLSLDALDALSAGVADATQLALARTSLVLARAHRRLAGDAVEPDTPLPPETVFALLDGGEAALPALEEAAQSGRLDALAPGFRALMTLRRPGLGHELTVGAHSLRAAALATHLPSSGVLATSVAAVVAPRALQIAALMHDIGKATATHEHPEHGAQPARAAARNFGLDDRTAVEVADLVSHHLALAETATRIDLDDEDAILSAAARIGRRGLLAPLHLLTAADSLATGRTTWTPWTAALVGSLVSRLDAALSDGAGIASRGEAVRTGALSVMPLDLRAERTFVDHAPLRYLASRQPPEVARDARLVAELALSGRASGARIAVSPGPTADTHALTIVSHDRPELLARMAGAISLAGLDILAVDAYEAQGHIAVDTFVVTSATLRATTTETFTKLERLLRSALKDRLELKTRLADRRRHYRPTTQGPITVTTVSAGFDTAVRVSAPDRPGLLHDLAQAVSATGLDIRWAKAFTVDGMAIDTFHVVDASGGPVDDTGVIGHLVMRMREIC